MIDYENVNHQGYTRSRDSNQDETDAYKNGSVDEIALAYTNSGLETLTYPVGEGLTGEKFNSIVFLGADVESSRMESMENYDYPTSLDLFDTVKSTGGK